MVNSYVEIPNPKGDGISWWCRGWYLSWKHGLLMNGISTPREEAPESAPAPSTTSGHREGTSSEPGWQPFPGHNQAGVLILDSSASRTLRNKCLLFISHLVYGIFVLESQTDQNNCINFFFQFEKYNLFLDSNILSTELSTQ